LRAIYFAVALVVSIGPAGANELALPGLDAGVAQAAQTPSRQASSEDTKASLFAEEPRSESAIEDTEAVEISDGLRAKLRAIVELMRDDGTVGADGSELLGSRIRVRCAVKKVVAKSKPSLSATPTLMLSEHAASGQATVSATTMEACTVKLLQVRRSTTAETSADADKRAFSIELPVVGETAR
jgi:hypothetical protein